MDNEQALEHIIRGKQLHLEASKITTAPLLKKGWMLVFCGWGIGLVPILGVLGWVLAFACAIIIGIIVITRGNTGGGLTLLLVGWLGTIPVALVSLLFWAMFGISGARLIGGW